MEEDNFNPLTVGKSSNTIENLSKDSIHQICSGQVIINLSSIIKELMENAMDAGATKIIVELNQSGKESLMVKDNGMGIAEKNYSLITKKYFTSKLRKFTDLEKMQTYGFRGEALSSICAMGNVQIYTKTKDEECSNELHFNSSGELVSSIKLDSKNKNSINFKNGSTILVDKIFQSLPVRRHQYEKNISREFAHLIQLMHSYALVCPSVSFSLFNVSQKRKKVFETTGNGSLLQNISDIFGSTDSTNLVSCQLQMSENFSYFFFFKLIFFFFLKSYLKNIFDKRAKGFITKV